MSISHAQCRTASKVGALGSVLNLLALGLALLMAASLQAADTPVLLSFDAANKLYEEGKFPEAASAYQQFLKSGQASAAVYYNLGNAFFKAGQIGRAIASYHQAEQITPRDPDVRANLQFARNQVQGPTFAIPGWKRWLNRLSLNEWTLLAGGIFWAWLLLLMLPQWRPALKAALRLYAVLLGVVFAFTCVIVFYCWDEHHAGRSAIVVAREAVVRQGPLEESRSTFTVHDGAELQVLDRKDDWLQVTTDPRRIGWVHRDQVLLAPEI